MGPLLLSGVEQAGGLLGSLIGNLFAGKRQREAQAHADKSALDAYNRDLNFWNLQNEYNSPVEKRKRLEEAGISAWTEFGQMSSEATSVKSPVADTVSPANMIMPQMTMLSNYIGLKKMANEQKMMEQNINNQKQVEENQRLQNLLMQDQIKYEMENARNWRNWQRDKSKEQIDLEIKNAYARLQDIENNIERFEWQKDNLWKYDVKFAQGKERQLEADIANSWMNYNKQKQEIENMKLGRVKTQWEINNLNREYNVKGFEEWKNNAYRKPYIEGGAGDPDKWSVGERAYYHIGGLDKMLEDLSKQMMESFRGMYKEDKPSIKNWNSSKNAFTY